MIMFSSVLLIPECTHLYTKKFNYFWILTHEVEFHNGNFRLDVRFFHIFQGDDATHTRNSSNTSTKSQASAGYSSQSSQLASHSRQSSEDSSHNRNPSSGSADTWIFGSMEKEKRRKKLDGGRVDAEDVIKELMEDIHIENMAVQEGEIMKTCRKWF